MIGMLFTVDFVEDRGDVINHATNRTEMERGGGRKQADQPAAVRSDGPGLAINEELGVGVAIARSNRVMMPARIRHIAGAAPTAGKAEVEQARIETGEIIGLTTGPIAALFDDYVGAGRRRSFGPELNRDRIGKLKSRIMGHADVIISAIEVNRPTDASGGKADAILQRAIVPTDIVQAVVFRAPPGYQPAGRRRAENDRQRGRPAGHGSRGIADQHVVIR